ncbi:MAG: hypothetical protein Q9169_005107 [Polycauliona sp. 2 TL-2023]
MDFNSDFIDEHETVVHEREYWKRRAQRFEKDSREANIQLDATERDAAPLIRSSALRYSEEAPGYIAADQRDILGLQAAAMKIKSERVNEMPPRFADPAQEPTRNIQVLPLSPNHEKHVGNLFGDWREFAPRSVETNAPPENALFADNESGPSSWPKSKSVWDKPLSGDEKLESEKIRALDTPRSFASGLFGTSQASVPSTTQPSSCFESTHTPPAQAEKRSASQAGFGSQWSGPSSLFSRASDKRQEVSRPVQADTALTETTHGRPSSAVPDHTTTPIPHSLPTTRGSSLRGRGGLRGGPRGGSRGRAPPPHQGSG